MSRTVWTETLRDTTRRGKERIGIKRYLQKMMGTGKGPKMVPLNEVFWSFVGSFVGIGLALLVNNIPKNRQYPNFWW